MARSGRTTAPRKLPPKKATKKSPSRKVSSGTRRRRPAKAVRKRKTDAVPALGSWDDVDRLLQRLAQVDARTGEIQAEADDRLRAVREATAVRLAPLADERKVLLAETEAFAEAHKADFGRDRSLRLAYGRVGWRAVEHIAFARGVKVDDVVAALEKRRLDLAVMVTKRPSKDVLATFDDDLLAELGVKRRRSDKFYVDLEAVQLDRP